MMKIILFLFCLHWWYCYCIWIPFWSSETNKFDNEAEQKFVEEMKSKIQAVRDFGQQVEERDESLNLSNFLNFGTLIQFWNYFSKVRLILWILWSVLKRDQALIKWKHAKKSLETERFAYERLRSSEIICEEVFKHDFFKKSEWNYVENTAKSAFNKITVTTSQGQFLRPVKSCSALSHSKTFSVYVSAAEDFNWKSNFIFYVFIRDNERYKVIAYLVKH